MIHFKEAAEQIRKSGSKKLTVRQLLALFGQHQLRGRAYGCADCASTKNGRSAQRGEESRDRGDRRTISCHEDREVVLTIGQLEKANRAPLRVTRQDTVAKAITLMMQNDTAYLAVMSGDRTVDGILSWRTISKADAAIRPANTVEHYLAPARIVEIDTPLFDARARHR